MSFDEFVFSAWFIQKTIKADLHVRINHAYPPRNGHQKVPEDSRGHHTEAGAKGLPVGHPVPGATRQPPPCYVSSPPPPRLRLHYPLSQFDPRVHDWRFGLYIPAPTTLPEA